MTKHLEGHTVQRFDGELSHLHMSLLEMGGLVLDQARMALNALLEEDLEDARRVLHRERDVDELELRIDDELVSVIARRSPVARDLRVVMAFSKAVTDLERVGDNARRIAQAAVSFYETGRSVPSALLMRDVETMGRQALEILDQGLSAFDLLDAEAAETLLAEPGRLSREFQSSLRRLATFLLEDARTVGHAIAITLVLRDLERIGEHGLNLAEQVIFLVRGRDVRHRDEGDPRGEAAPRDAAP